MALALGRCEDLLTRAETYGYEVVREVALHVSPALVAYSTTKRKVESMSRLGRWQTAVAKRSAISTKRFATLYTHYWNALYA